MLGRLQYYIKRVNEAPVRVTFGKAYLKFLKKYYAIEYYRKKKNTKTTSMLLDARTQDSLTLFGSSLTEIIITNVTSYSGYAKNAVRRAQEVLTGKFPCLGYGVGIIPRKEDWWRDQFHNYQWPDCYFDACDFIASDQYCDVKVPWEYSRLQYLVWLAEGYVFDEANKNIYVAAFEEIVLDWIDYNPTAFGVNWTCPMEAAIRAVNLSVSTSILSGSLTKECFVKILGSLNDHVKFIERFPEYSDVPGNHFLADLMGIFVTQFILGVPASEREKSVDYFLNEAMRQFEDDGCHIERAPVYHRLCLDMVAIVTALALRANMYQKDSLLNVLDCGLDFCKSVSSVAGKLPVIGDCDSGHVLWFGSDERDFGALASFTASARGKKLKNNPSTGLALWLSGLANIKYAEASTYQPICELSISPKTQYRSGFLSASSGDLVAVMRVGHQGLGGRASHDHDDALSLWVFQGARDIIVDQGCHSYTLDTAIRQRYIRSSAHNVVQQLDTDRFIPTEGSVCKSIRGAETGSSWEHRVDDELCALVAELNATNRQGQKFHNCGRVVELKADTITVRDCWSWRSVEAVAEIRWHFGPEILPNIESEDLFTLLSSESGPILAHVHISGASDLRLEVFNYEYSPKYGASQTCHGVRVIVSSHRKCEITTTFSFSPDNLSGCR